jgi:hypothetical protein
MELQLHNTGTECERPATSRRARKSTLACRPQDARLRTRISFRLRVVGNAAFDNWTALSEGTYLLRSNINDWIDARLWKAYIQLTQAEDAFRCHKEH